MNLPAPFWKMASFPGADGNALFGEHAKRRIELWHGSLQQVGWSSVLYLLSDEERRRADTLVFERDARRFVVSHALLRMLLSQLTAIPVSQLRLRLERGSKPVLETAMGQPIHFSLSRSEERVLIGFASRPLGVDIEWLGRALDIQGLADHVLSRRELDAFGRLDPRDRQKAFLRCWTQKEAYLKAIGEGLHMPLDSVEVSLDPAAPPGLKSICGDQGTAAEWFVEIVTPEEGYIGAVVVPGRLWQVEMTGLGTSSLLVST
jgi:4'-phosphopantetheinyl transferase